MVHKHMGWLRDRLQDRPASASDPMDNIWSFAQAVGRSAAADGSAALDLVHQAAEMIGGIEDRANETQARAQRLVSDAIEKLKLADGRVQSAENAKRTALGVASARLEKAVNALECAESRLAAAEARALEAERRADGAEAALRRIEDAIRTQLLGERHSDGDQAAAA